MITAIQKLYSRFFIQLKYLLLKLSDSLIKTCIKVPLANLVRQMRLSVFSFSSVAIFQKLIEKNPSMAGLLRLISLQGQIHYTEVHLFHVYYCVHNPT